MLDNALRHVENALATAVFAAVATLALLNVVSRYFLGGSLAFTSEITVNLAVWLIMIGSVIGLREGAHLGFSLLYDRTTGTARAAMTVLITVAVLAYLAVFIAYGTQLVVHQVELGRATPAIGIPHWLFTLALPVGGVLGSVRAIQAAVVSIRMAGADNTVDPIETADEGAQR
ncbi:TRAP transporter small permease [Nocardiopsis nanhaiensis]